MESRDYIASLGHDMSMMSEAARSAGLDVDVPTCPDWKMRNLITHTGVVHRHKTETLRGEHASRSAPLPEIPSNELSDESVLAWFDAGAAELLEVCGSADLDASTWTWCPHQHTNAWWVRRMAHETAIHGADAVIADGRTPMMDERLAVDGIDEILDEFLVGGPSWGTVSPRGGVVRLQASGRTWTVRLAEFSGTSPTSGKQFVALPSLLYEEESEPTATVTADPLALNLWLWGRGALPDGAASGDLSLVADVRATAADATG